ncbi:glycosyltransferase family 4 protein [Geomesophilobacter sediminis]|uniref:Glycosyltransferase family 4 protein n=1 Tax=Geomesophilobacter sediminis TaxID=2798584 RepID=A0A8J7LV39_9BACT|nr:glycosyltransferase family 4 protein [Geomesophilobacter sediminis]MBJ6725354.1 glycosyltransferase family 4 protein [Geomesophilobacter sediminis]
MGRNVAMVVFSHYPKDPRVRREAEALADAGISVDVFCLKDRGALPRELCNGVQVYRLPLQRSRSGKLNYVLEYGAFIAASAGAVALFHLKRHYRLVHVHNMPDILVLSALIPKLAGAKVILDLHDPVPEVYMTKYALAEDHPVVRGMCLLERLSVKFADRVLTPNFAFQERFIARGCPREKIDIVMNSAQEEVLCCGTEPPAREGFVVMFHGVINRRSGIHVALEALRLVRDRIPGLCFEVYGEGEARPGAERQARELGLEGMVRFHGYRPQEELGPRIREMSVGLVPNISSPFTEINLPTRILEYLSLGKPVIAPRTRGITDYFDDRTLLFFEAGDPGALAETLFDAYAHPEKREEVARAGTSRYQPYRWARQKEKLVAIVERTIGAC